MEKKENVSNKEVAKSVELPKWKEFVNMVEKESSEKVIHTPSAYYIYHKYSKSC